MTRWEPLRADTVVELDQHEYSWIVRDTEVTVDSRSFLTELARLTMFCKSDEADPVMTLAQ